jgi:hypothetical protein
MFLLSVVSSAVTVAEADPVQAKVTDGGVHVADALACAWQLPWQFALALHWGGATWPVQLGAVNATEQLPWQLPEHVSDAPPGETVQLPVQPPLHVPAQWTDAEPGIAVQLPLQVPWQVPEQVPFTEVFCPFTTQVPLHVAPHVPAHCTVGALAVTSHSPLQSAEQEPVQFATGAWTEPWHVPVQEPEQVPWSWPVVHVGTVGGVQLALALQLASQLASALTLTAQPPPEMLSPQERVAEADAPASVSLAPPSLPPPPA